MEAGFAWWHMAIFLPTMAVVIGGYLLYRSRKQRG